MARSRTEPRPGNPSFLSRLRGRKPRETQMAHVTREEKTNPITGTHTETTTRKTHPRGHGAGGHGGRGPLAKKPHAGTGAGVQRRKPGIGDKISGAMLKMEGSIERKPGKKAAGARRMHGTDGKGEHRAVEHVR